MQRSQGQNHPRKHHKTLQVFDTHVSINLVHPNSITLPSKWQTCAILVGHWLLLIHPVQQRNVKMMITPVIYVFSQFTLQKL